MNTSTTVDVFSVTGYDVRTTMVDRVDNQGEPCEHCSVEGRYVDATVYGVVQGGDVDLVRPTVKECCVYCIPDVIGSLDPLEAVKVELGNSLDDEADNGLMANQDDTRPHPDAL